MFCYMTDDSKYLKGYKKKNKNQRWIKYNNCQEVSKYLDHYKLIYWITRRKSWEMLIYEILNKNTTIIQYLNDE